MTVLDRAAERHAKQDRAMPKVPGLNASQLSGEMSTGPNRLKDRQTLSGATAFRATSSKRYSVRPSSGKVADIHAGAKRAGQDDGSDYFAEWRERGGIFQLPEAKTRQQDQLAALCVAWNAGEREPGYAELIKAGIAAIERTDPKHARAWRVAMAGVGLYSQ